MQALPPLVLHNTLNNRREEFQPHDDGNVQMYVCGPTVYGPVHVGNARPAVVFDLLYGLLKRRYRKATYVRNITDIDDKIINTAKENGEEPEVLARRWQQQYHTDMQQLGVAPPDRAPTATTHIPQMIDMINRLIERGFAYAEQGHVLFHVPSFSDYGALSNRRREDMIAGARVEVAPYKRDPADFVLWKPSPDDIVGWDSPWGRGRPGWHIECSAMAAACLGEEIDIHGGGQDLIFPHHENELAQSRCAHGTPTFARYWLHNGHVRMDGEKMSKSLNNMRLLKDALAMFPGEAVRLALLTAHYRQPLNWTEALLTDAKTTLDRWYRALDGETIPSPPTMPTLNVHDGNANAVERALADDLNTPDAIAALHRIANDVFNAVNNNDSTLASLSRGFLYSGGAMLGLFQQTPKAWLQRNTATADSPHEEEIEAIIARRAQARQQRDFTAADAARDELAARGIVLEDTPTGTTWRAE